MRTQVLVLHPDQNLQGALSLFEERQISGAPVIESNGSVVGVLSRSDLLSSMARKDDFERTLVTDRMTPFVFHARPEQNLVELLNMMTTARIHRVVVVDEANRPVGMVTTLDLLQEYLEHLESKG